MTLRFDRQRLRLCALAAAALGGCAAAAPPDNVAVTAIDLAPLRIEDGAGGVVAVDLTGDGRRELVVSARGAIGAYDVSGARLWSVSAPIVVSVQAESQGLPGLHAPGVAVADIAPGGKPALLYLDESGSLVALDGATGRRIGAVNPPPPAGALRWEHLAAGSFRRRGAHDILLQATDAKGYRRGRHLAAYALDRLFDDGPETAPLWRRDDFPALPHAGARLADLDGDGRHEIIGGAILRPDGSVAATLPVPSEHRNHIDSVFVADVRPDRPGLEVVALEEKEQNRVFVYGLDGVIWSAHHRHEEPQNAAVGDFDPDRPGLEIWARSRSDTEQRPFVFDSAGRLIGDYRIRHVAPADWTVKGVEVISPIHWTGDGREFAAAKERHEDGDVAIFEPVDGRFVLRIRESAKRLYVADVLGDWREELVVAGTTQLRIYRNTAPNPDPRRARLWQDDRYRQSKIDWNYYNP